MRKMFLTALFAMALSGCVTQPQRKTVSAPVDVGPVPECGTKDVCDAMWVAALDSLQLATRMKIQTANDFYIQTFTSPSIPNVQGSARKVPLGEGRYAIKSEFGCRMGCEEWAASAAKLFNLRVANAGKRLEPLGAK
ncbi:hypothetical protein [Comamonas terrigena]|uniref:hypothetical protein n=1 Tax=Comamonas terrigena TaxID=32013 RepID=UPI002899DBC0|nr:hypothetical protein [Comamonas terrigena]